MVARSNSESELVAMVTLPDHLMGDFNDNARDENWDLVQKARGHSLIRCGYL